MAPCLLGALRHGFAPAFTAALVVAIVAALPGGIRVVVVVVGRVAATLS